MVPFNPLALKYFLRESNLTQRELASEMGTFQTQVNRWSNGKNKPAKSSVKILAKIARKYGVDVNFYSGNETNFQEGPKFDFSQFKEVYMHADLSQYEVARRLDTSQTNVCRWSSGITSPSPKFRRKIIDLEGKLRVQFP
jgi:transcriptional regulator with XRE-family HTH domain